ncbi:MAG TPA: WGxxGxxG family protein [Sphingomicrobium sp.]
MRLRLVLAVLAGAVAFSQPSSAQFTNDDVGGIPTETQERLRAGDQTTAALNWLGVLGLLGLLGLRKGHDEDSYHPSDIE